MMQIIDQTDEQKMSMYMKLSKKEIIEMLIACNKILDARPVKYYYNGINQEPPIKMCNCNRKNECTSSFPCDGNCR